MTSRHNNAISPLVCSSWKRRERQLNRHVARSRSDGRGHGARRDYLRLGSRIIISRTSLGRRGARKGQILFHAIRRKRSLLLSVGTQMSQNLSFSHPFPLSLLKSENKRKSPSRVRKIICFRRRRWHRYSSPLLCTLRNFPFKKESYQD
jgi:hypothetical protein